MLEGELITELQSLFKEQDRLYEEWEQRVVATAEAERRYQTAMRKRALLEKDGGTPITFISSFIKGDEDIAELRKERDICEALEKISENKVTDIRKRIQVTDSQATREWSRRDSNIPVPPPGFE